MSKIDIIEGMPLKTFEKTISDEMKKIIEFFEKEISKLRTNRAHPSLVEDVMVSMYGRVSPLKNVAVISASDALTLVIQPFDINTIGEIEKGISQASIGATARNDGKVIKLSFPPMSQARRLELTKMLKTKHEEALVGMRKIRQEVQTEIKDKEKAKKISEDFSKRLQKQLQTVVEQTTGKIESIHSAKEISLRD